MTHQFLLIKKRFDYDFLMNKEFAVLSTLFFLKNTF